MSQVERQQQQQQQRRRPPDGDASQAACAASIGADGQTRRATGGKLSGADVAQTGIDCKLPAAAAAAAAAAPALIDATAQAEGARLLAARKLAEEFDKTNYQPAELNNNSIAPSPPPPPPPSSKQAGAISSSSISRAEPNLRTPPTQAQQQQQRLETPLNLLAGLRMHASNLRAQRAEQQQQQQQQQQSASGAATSRPRPAQQASASGQQVASKSEDAAPRTSPASSPATHSPAASYVESSLNPPEAAQPAERGPGATSASKPPSAYLASGQASGRSYLIKQSQPSEPTLSRSLFSTLTAASQRPRPSETPQSLRAPPTLFDDSPASRRQRLQSLAGVEIIDLGHEDDEDDEDEDEDEEEEEEDDEELDYQEQDRTDSSASHNLQAAGHLLSNLRQQQQQQQQLQEQQERETKRLVDSSPESQILKRKRPFGGPSARLSGARRGRSPARRREHPARSPMGAGNHQQQQQHGGKKALGQQAQGRSQSQTRASPNEASRPPSFNTTTLQHQHQQRDSDMKMASCRKLDLLEQVAHLECGCGICARNRKLAAGALHDSGFYGNQHSSTSKLAANFSLNRSGLGDGAERHYPKTRFVHMVLKSIILFLCTLLLLLLIVGGLLISHHLPHSLDKVVNASRSFNVTIAGRR